MLNRECDAVNGARLGATVEVFQLKDGTYTEPTVLRKLTNVRSLRQCSGPWVCAYIRMHDQGGGGLWSVAITKH